MNDASWTDSMHAWGISVIVYLQNVLQNHSHLMVKLSHFGDPRFAFTVYFPAAFYLRKSTGIHVLWVAVIAEWLNAVCKWLLHGERPYWWVHESGFYSKDAIPKLNQFSITCETGPGSPSGHAMITSAVWYVLVNDFLICREIRSGVVKFITWSAYVAMVSAVCLSRLFIATHFPHQVVAGTFVGIILAKSFESVSTTSLTQRHYIITAAALSLIAVVTYLLLLAVGVDPLWSVDKALKWCERRDWVNLDTSLFYSLVRDVSSLLGLGLGLKLIKTTDGESNKDPCPLFHLAIALGFCIASDCLKIPHDNVTIFYSLGFFKHILVVSVVVAGVSRLYIRGCP